MLRLLVIFMLLSFVLSGCRSAPPGGRAGASEAETPPAAESLHDAVRQDDFDAVLKLLEAGADFNEFDDQGDTPLHVVSWHGSAEIARALLEAGADVNPFNRLSQTPMFVAQERLHDYVAAVLAEYGGEKGWGVTVPGPPLHKAVAEYDRERFEELLATERNVDARNKQGSTPLSFAAFGGHTSFAKRLLASGADVNASDHKGVTPLHMAAEGGNPTMAQV